MSKPSTSYSASLSSTINALSSSLSSSSSNLLYGSNIDDTASKARSSSLSSDIDVGIASLYHTPDVSHASGVDATPSAAYKNGLLTDNSIKHRLNQLLKDRNGIQQSDLDAQADPAVNGLTSQYSHLSSTLINGQDNQDSLSLQYSSSSSTLPSIQNFLSGDSDLPASGVHGQDVTMFVDSLTYSETSNVCSNEVASVVKDKDVFRVDLSQDPVTITCGRPPYTLTLSSDSGTSLDSEMPEYTRNPACACQRLDYETLLSRIKFDHGYSKHPDKQNKKSCKSSKSDSKLKDVETKAGLLKHSPTIEHCDIGLDPGGLSLDHSNSLYNDLTSSGLCLSDQELMTVVQQFINSDMNTKTNGHTDHKDVLAGIVSDNKDVLTMLTPDHKDVLTGLTSNHKDVLSGLTSNHKVSGSTLPTDKFVVNLNTEVERGWSGLSLVPQSPPIFTPSPVYSSASTPSPLSFPLPHHQNHSLYPPPYMDSQITTPVSHFTKSINQSGQLALPDSKEALKRVKSQSGLVETTNIKHSLSIPISIKHEQDNAEIKTEREGEPKGRAESDKLDVKRESEVDVVDNKQQDCTSVPGWFGKGLKIKRKKTSL